MRETQTFSKGFAGNPQFRTPRLKIKAARERDAYVIRIAGDLDLFERSRLERAFDDAYASQANRVLLDLEGLTFIDAAGLNALRAVCRRSETNGNRLRVTRGTGIVAEMFCLTALDLKLPFTSVKNSLDQAHQRSCIENGRAGRLIDNGGHLGRDRRGL